MDEFSELNKAIADYRCQLTPSDFEQSVRENSRLSESTRRTFAEVWECALDFKHWKSCTDLIEGIDEVRRVLRATYPELTEQSAAAIANATGYMWR